MLAMSDEQNWRDLPPSDPARKKKPKPPFYARAEERVSEPGPEGVASWYVLLVTPGQEQVAAAHLAGRGFGLYIPMRRALVAGPSIEACHPAPELAGYVLASLWHDDLSRARHCPGVIGVLSRANGEPVTLSEAEVRKLRLAEAATDAALAHSYQQIELGKKLAAEAAEQREKARKSKKKSKAEKRRRKAERRKARRLAS